MTAAPSSKASQDAVHALPDGGGKVAGDPARRATEPPW
ncbi:hypothetical protein STENM223S_09610 [Streptomyces tendae]